MFSPEAIEKFESWQADWRLFAREYLAVNLDIQQEEALHAIQHNQKVAIASGTSRGKDFLMAVASICFLYLTPAFDDKGKLVGNTKVILTAPTGRQVSKIIMPEIGRLFQNSVYLPGTLNSNSINIPPYDEWFLHAFKADDTNTEAWTGFHAVNIFFGVTEATGLSQTVFDAIEGNLQGNSRLVIVFNPNINHGYAASAMKSPAFKKIVLNSLDAPNVIHKKIIHPGQVDYPWIRDRITDWCMQIPQSEYNVLEADFEFEGIWYRPNDLFRAKVLGLFPKISEGVLVPPEWIQLANKRWLAYKADGGPITKPLRLGVDVAGMGRDSTCYCKRHGNYVPEFKLKHGEGSANHMEVAGDTKIILQQNTNAYNGFYAQAFLDTIGEGAGVFSRLIEQNVPYVFSCKFSEAAKDGGGNDHKDFTGQYSFLNMRAYLYWAVRDWLNPANKSEAMLPPDDQLLQELSETKWKFRSDGRIQIEDKEELKKRIKRSPDKSDALANTFWPIPDVDPIPKKKQNIAQFFH